MPRHRALAPSQNAGVALLDCRPRDSDNLAKNGSKDWDRGKDPNATALAISSAASMSVSDGSRATARSGSSPSPAIAPAPWGIRSIASINSIGPSRSSCLRLSSIVARRARSRYSVDADRHAAFCQLPQQSSCAPPPRPCQAFAVPPKAHAASLPTALRVGQLAGRVEQHALHGAVHLGPSTERWRRSLTS